MKLGIQREFETSIGIVDITEEEFEQLLDEVIQRIDEVGNKSQVGGVMRQRASNSGMTKSPFLNKSKQWGGVSGLAKGPSLNMAQKAKHAAQQQKSAAGGQTASGQQYTDRQKPTSAAPQQQAAATPQQAQNLQTGILKAASRSETIKKQLLQMIAVAMQKAQQ